MTKRIKKLLDDLINKRYHKYRQNIHPNTAEDFTKGMASVGMPDVQRVVKRLEWVLNRENPVVLPDERIALLRTVKKIPEIFTQQEWVTIKGNHYIHELGRVCNICPDYATTISDGLEARKMEALQALELCAQNCDHEGKLFIHAVINTIDAVIAFSDRYAVEAENSGNTAVAAVFKRIPRHGASSFLEALQFFRLLHFTLWCSGNYHNTVGRFDQFMYPYLKADLDSGKLTVDEAFELLQEFFISFNRDSDLYPGMQQGDNGQSMVLGGINGEGKDAYNILSEMCLKVSLELKLIDPKINLRVHKDTPLEVFKLGTELTKQGLGFPQYSNDEVVIPGLVEKGYSLMDARNYVVAACWEFIIPGEGMDIPNIGALSFAGVVDRCIHERLSHCIDFQDLMDAMNECIRNETKDLASQYVNIYMEPSPFMSLLMSGTLKNARDISKGARYNNFGLHGTGISTAADSLAAIKKFVFDDHEVSSKNLLQAIDNDYAGYEELCARLRYDAPKMGNDDDYVDSIAVELLDMFSNAVSSLKNEREGCYRAGTGSAMYYLWHVKGIGASPDGRRKGEPLPANYSPSLFAKTKGPVSVIFSFSKPDLRKVINGGPLTLELHDTVFRNEESTEKTAMLVKSFMDMGGHQLQLNSVNREKLLKAQKNPDAYRNLIVRVWGWSGYFVELDKEYQDHIIRRAESVL